MSPLDQTWRRHHLILAKWLLLLVYSLLQGKESQGLLLVRAIHDKIYCFFCNLVWSSIRFPYLARLAKKFCCPSSPTLFFPNRQKNRGELRTTSLSYRPALCCSTIAMIKYKYRRFGRPLSTVLSTLAWTLVPCNAVDWFSRPDDTMESRKNWGSVCVISDQLFLSEASSRTLSIQLGGHILTISTTSYRHWRKE